jgi:predicted GNAT family N-acyltransferase
MNFSFVTHGEADDKLKREIIELKNMHWHYPFASHQQWMAENLRDSDVHLLLRNQEQLIGYMNLVKLQTNIPQYENSCWGVGNVCVHPAEQNKSLGYLLMNLADFFLHKDKSLGLLLCKDKLVEFYTKSKWIKVEDANVQIAQQNVDANLLISLKIRILPPPKKTVYSDLPTRSSQLKRHKIIIDRLF